MAYGERNEGGFNTDRDGVRNYTRVFRIDTGNAALRPEWGVAGIAINRYDSYPSDAGALAVSASSVPVSGQLGWFDVTYQYTSRPFDANSGGDATGTPGQNDPTVQPDPTLRTPTVKWGQNTRTLPFTKDYNPAGRKLVQNSAGQPFEGQEVEDITQTITVGFNRPATTDVCAKQGQFVNHVNDGDFAVIPIFSPYPAGTLRCNSWTGSLQYEADYGWYVAAEVELEFKWDGWTRKYIDAGYYYKVAGEYVDGQQVYRKFRDNATGQPLDAPRYLNGAGLPLPDGDPPVELTFYPCEEADFTTIFS